MPQPGNAALTIRTGVPFATSSSPQPIVPATESPTTAIVIGRTVFSGTTCAPAGRCGKVVAFVVFVVVDGGSGGAVIGALAFRSAGGGW